MVYPLLYKYCKFSKENHDFENLKNDVLYFKSPTEYNDPYEGVISVPVVDIIKALFVAKIISSSEYSEELLADINLAFVLPQLFQSVASKDDMQEIRKLLFDWLGKIATKQQVAPEVLIAFKLFNDDAYFHAFSGISSAVLSVREYEVIVKKALLKVDEFSGISKDYLCELFIENYAEKYRIVNSLRRKTEVIVPIYLVDVVHNTPFKRDTYEETLVELNRAAKDTFQFARQLPGKFFKTTCLSENSKSILMWSHYADQHKGFCIEYDFNKANGDILSEHLAKVTYSDELPKFDDRSLLQLMQEKVDPAFEKDPDIARLSVETCFEAILTKNSVWAYEEEWRIVLDNFSGVQIGKLPYATRIIMGINIEEGNKRLLLQLAKEKCIPVYQAFLLPDKYEIGYYPVT